MNILKSLTLSAAALLALGSAALADPMTPTGYDGPYYGGPYTPYWDRLPYACGVFGYC